MAIDASRVWWKHGTIDQIDPRSFQDSDGDGLGDLEGLQNELALEPNGVILRPIAKEN